MLLNRQISLLFLIGISFILSFSSCMEGEENNNQNFDDPVASFSWTTEDLEDYKVKVYFKNNSEYSDQYQWDFGDGSPVNYSKEPSHVYPRSSTKPNEFTVILKATNGEDGRFNRRSRVVAIEPFGK